ncbi:MAG: haloacid dehalogenase-like hydrolase [Bacilli bacterium]|nr:haloacid dehalogenase-like hydrolase [Acholeplasmataceae bacterium]MDY2902652.1 haloacid dehalogenase-like hydrolase [Bacilli bacterium]
MRKRPVVALMYDFDKTLCNEDMQNYGFIPDLEMTPEQFWTETSVFGEKQNMEKILAYMYMMVTKAEEKGITLTKKYLRSLGTSIKFYKGVVSWFKRINDYGASLGLDVEHYIISSGIKDIIEGSEIAHEFKKIYACEYVYDKNGAAIWPKLAINYTMKTQFVFRISKGVDRINDDDTVNEKMSEQDRRVLYRNMIYLGDGITDIPCMRLVKDKQGKSIAVYPKGKKEKVAGLLRDKRVNYISLADYSENSELENIVKLQLEYIALLSKIEEKEKKQLISVTSKED